MKRLETSNSNSFSSSSSSYYQKLLGNFAFGLGESSKKAKRSAKTRCKVVEKENGRCELCDEIARNKMERSSVKENGKEEERQQEVVVLEENMVVIIDDDKEEDKKVLVVNDEVEKEKNEILEGKVGENSELEEGKIVLIDAGIDVEALLDEVENNVAREGAERNNSDDGVAAGDVVEENIEDTFSIDIIGEGDLLLGWDEWKSKAEQNLYCSNFWLEMENIGLNILGVEVEPPANDWIENFWQL